MQVGINGGVVGELGHPHPACRQGGRQKQAWNKKGRETPGKTQSNKTTIARPDSLSVYRLRDLQGAELRRHRHM